MDRRLRIEPGAWVTLEGQRFCIRQVLDLETVLVGHAETGETRHATINDLHAPETAPQTPTETAVTDLAAIEDKDWRRVRERFAAIEPLLGRVPATCG
jgi:putative transposase